MSPNTVKQTYLWVTVSLAGLFLLVGCQTAQVNSAENVGMDVAAVETAVLLPTPTLALAQPVIVVSEDAPTAMPSFSLAEPAELTRQATVATNTPEPTLAPTIKPEAEITNTLQPTFTPPSLPLTSLEDHYWFRRPIPEGGTVWTDKVYPYGSTRGGTLRTHHGVEFYVPSGTEVLSVASGTVRVAGTDEAIAYGPHINFYGNLVVIEHDTQLNGQPVFTLYGHLSQIFVGEGQRIESQQIIAYSGASGVADGAHLHLEVRIGQNDYDLTHNPLLWLYPFPDRGTVVGRVVWPDGSLVAQAPVSLNRIDAASRYLATTSYADTSVNADSEWNENFAIDDVDAGFYEAVVTNGTEKYKAEVWVYPYRTSSVEIIIQP
ncbi:MAG: M23 family metallopeptidase [Chloroflexi bacterium]|nr:M23 family metallopeptidase [Chloroflexota bacterium]